MSRSKYTIRGLFCYAFIYLACFFGRSAVNIISFFVGDDPDIIIRRHPKKDRASALPVHGESTLLNIDGPEPEGSVETEIGEVCSVRVFSEIA